MSYKKPIVYPYIPNSIPAKKEEMLKEIDAKSMEELYADIPESIRFKGKLNLPHPLLAEAELVRHIEELLDKNVSAHERLSFLGAGCWQHYVPAVCDEINSRGEFLTAYAGEPYEDKGRFQALFEYESMMGELLNMDVVNVPNYDGFQAAGTALLMAGRITGRTEALICGTVGRDKLCKMSDYIRPQLNPVLLNYLPNSGLIDLNDLKSKISAKTAAVFFENPSYLGLVETQAAEIANIAHQYGALCVVYVDPTSLGVMNPPVEYGGDIACGDIQSLGIHMWYGGGHGGFIATKDDPAFVMEFPSRLFGISSTITEGEYGFGDVAYERTSFAKREEGKEWVGTASALWGITAGVYLALMGPQGMVELGEGIMQRTAYAIKKLSQVPGLKIPFTGIHFKEFVVDFNQCRQTVKSINKSLLSRGIFGGKDLSIEFPALRQCALYAVTEIHSKADIDRLAATMQEVLK